MKTIKINRAKSILLLFLMVGCALFAQTTTGVVTDIHDKALMGCVVLNSNTVNQTITNSEGAFELLASEGDLISVFFNKQEIASQLVGTKPMVFIICDNPYSKDVNAAYGTLSRVNSAAAIDVIYSDKIANNSFTNAEHAIVGQLAGLTTVQSSGELGSNGLDFYVRGKSSYASNVPLVLVDGFESDFDHLMTAEIESVSILKDAVATAMYGMRGANGVIVVTTKKGNVGPTKININADFGLLQSVATPEYVDAFTYATLANEAHANDGLSPRYSTDELLGYEQDADSYNYPNVDWKEKMLKNTVNYSTTSMEVQGGSEKVSYYSMLGFMTADGFFKNTTENTNFDTDNSFNRFNFRANAKIKLHETTKLHVGAGGRVQYTNDIEAGYANLYKDVLQMPANRYVPLNEDGTYGGDNFYRNNPLGELEGRGYDKSHSRNVNFNLKLDHQMDYLLEGLSASLETSFQNDFTVTEIFSASYMVYDRNESSDGDGNTLVNYTPYGEIKPLSYKSSDSNDTEMQERTQTFRAYLNYDKIWGNDHQLTSSLIFDRQELVYKDILEPYLFQGVLAKVNYGYLGKYYVDVVAAYNGTNSYMPGSQYGLFPAVGLSWIASEELFLKDRTWLDYFKVRTSYGMVGNSLLNGYRRFMYLPDYSTSSSKSRFGLSVDNTISGLSETDLVNTAATWEKGYQYNLGFDAVIMKKFNISVDYFNERRTDILQSIDSQVSDMIGITVPNYNYGEVKNQGVDVTMGYTSRKNEDFSWNVSANVGYAHNEITQCYELTNPSYSFIGNSINTIYGLEADGFYNDAAEIASSPENTFTTVQAGDVKYVNHGGDPNTIDEYDYHSLGNSFPELNFGVNVGANFKGVYISALFSGSALADCMLNSNLVLRPLSDGYDNISEYAANNRWTPTTGDNALLPRLTTSDNYNNYLNSTLYMYSKNYIRLRTLECGYNLPKEWVARLKMSNAKVYLRGHNLVSFDQMPDVIDPEVTSGFPLLKSYNVGLNIQF